MTDIVMINGVTKYIDDIAIRETPYNIASLSDSLLAIPITITYSDMYPCCTVPYVNYRWPIIFILPNHFPIEKTVVTSSVYYEVVGPFHDLDD